MEQRNPFRIRKAEQIGTESTFHRLFGPQMIEILSENRDYLWDRTQIIRSAPGAGKTSLLRLFSAESLAAIYDYKTSPDYKLLYESAQALGVFNATGPAVLGVLTSCFRTYANIEYLKIDDTDKQKIFLALLNTRVLLGVLKSVCVFCQQDYPQGLEKIEIRPPMDSQISFENFFGGGNGKELFNSARNIEKTLCSAVDSVGGAPLGECPGTLELLAWKALSEDSIYFDGQPLNVKTLIMLDDIHELTPSQRQLLLLTLEQKYPTACWVAERYDALASNQIIFDGSIAGREYKPCRIEEWANDKKSKTNFQKGLGYIANQRVREAKTVELSDFEILLAPLERSKRIVANCNKALQTVSERVKETTLKEKRFQSWVEQVDISDKSLYEQAIEWRALEILINRKQKRGSTLFPNIELPVEEYDKMNGSDIRTAARLFIASEFKIPYYHGLDTLKSLSSGNIEQFLDVSGNIFEEILAASTLRSKKHEITVERQEAIIRKVAKERLDSIPKRMPYGTNVRNFVLQISQLARRKTYESTAPYAPGVTGIAISQHDLIKISDDAFIKRHPKYEPLVSVLREAIAKNILDPRFGQHCKGQVWFVMYLNRLLCAHFELPLEYGGWKEQSLETLLRWVFEPTQEKISQEELLFNE